MVILATGQKFVFDPSVLGAGIDIETIGKPVADGPFLLTNYTKGQGITLKRNPYWYGKKPGLAEVDFKIIEDTNTEVQAMRDGKGIHVTYVPVDEQGLVVSELAASGAQAVVVTPAHQSPTGVVLSPQRRHALTDWAQARGKQVWVTSFGVDGTVFTSDLNFARMLPHLPLGKVGIGVIRLNSS